MIDRATEMRVRELVRREMDARLRSPVLNSQVSPRGVTQSRVAKRLVTRLPVVAQEFDEVNLEAGDQVTEWIYLDNRWRPLGTVDELVSALPSSPYDGQVVRYLADDTDGVVWTFRYRDDSASSYKWEFVGGSALADEVAASQTRSSATYGDLTTAGPAITVPLAGDYEVEIDCYIESQVTGGIITAFASYEIGGTAAVDADGIQHNASSTQFEGVMGSRSKSKTITAASTALTMKYRGDGANNSAFRDRRIAATPIRVG